MSPRSTPEAAAPDRSLTIAIDYTTGVYPGAGVARYSRSLVTALTQLDRRNSYRLFYGRLGLPRKTPEYARMRTLLEHFGNVEVREIPLSPRHLNIIWQRARLPLPLDALIGRADVVHSPDFLGPPLLRGRSIITIHDLSFMVVPEYSDPGNREYLRAALPRSIQRAHRVVAVSEATRQDVIRLFGVKPQKVVTIPNGVDTDFRPLTNRELNQLAPRLRQQLLLPSHFILNVGTLEPRKNLLRLLGAYARMRARGTQRGHDLVLAGRKGWMYEDIFRKVEELGLKDNVHFLDYVPDEDLNTLYNLATLFVYPSLYEGFGLPVLEAMACATPVITSKGGALGEVAGNAALLIDPQSEESIAAALETVLEREEVRAFLQEAGPNRAANFPWTATARQMLGVYEGVV